MAKVVCPRCHSESVVDGVCLFCGPEAVQAYTHKAPPREWKVPKHQATPDPEEELRHRKQDAGRDEERNAWLGSLSSLVVAVIVIGGVGWLWSSGKLHRNVDMTDLPTATDTGVVASFQKSGAGLPTVLKKPPSAFRGELAMLGRELQEFTADTERKFVGNEDATKDDVERYRNRLQVLRDASREMEPKLTREETRVLFAFEHAERMLDAFLKEEGGDSPDVAGLQVEAAKEQIQRALAVARGEKVDNLMVVFAKKAQASADLEKQLESNQ